MTVQKRLKGKTVLQILFIKEKNHVLLALFLTPVSVEFLQVPVTMVGQCPCTKSMNLTFAVSILDGRFCLLGRGVCVKWGGDKWYWVSLQHHLQNRKRKSGKFTLRPWHSPLLSELQAFNWYLLIVESLS